MAQAPTTTPASFAKIAEQLSLGDDEYVPYGEGVGKILRHAAFVPDDASLPGKLVLVSAINRRQQGKARRR